MNFNAMARNFLPATATVAEEACAGIDEEKINGDWVSFRSGNINAPTQKIKLYFDTPNRNSSIGLRTHLDCEEKYYKPLRQQLQNNAKDILGLVFIGNADKQPYDNNQLANDRLEYARDFFTAGGILTELNDAVTGDVSAGTHSTTANDPEYRSAEIYVFYKHTCPSEAIQYVAEFKNTLETVKVDPRYSKKETYIEGALDLIKEVQKICGDGDGGKPLSPVESKNYETKMAELLKYISDHLMDISVIEQKFSIFMKTINVTNVTNITNSFDEFDWLTERYYDLSNHTSVWKNKSGKFNTARLASDSVAGVVLGTAGGLITSNLVRKNQIRTGFEDISCTVGGQKIADWGDEFTVGFLLNIPMYNPLPDPVIDEESEDTDSESDDATIDE